MNLDSILSHYDRGDWSAILDALVSSGFVDAAEAPELLAAANARGLEFAVLAETTLYDQALASVGKAIDAGVPFDEFDPEALAAPFSAPDAGIIDAIVQPDLQIPYNASRVDASKTERGDQFFRFTAVLDKRTTDICRSLDGTMLPVDDPFWRLHSPPLHDRCRSGLIGYSGRMAGKIGITSRPQPGEYEPPEEGWGSDEFRYDTVLAGKDHLLEALARAKINNPLW